MILDPVKFEKFQASIRYISKQYGAGKLSLTLLQPLIDEMQRSKSFLVKVLVGLYLDPKAVRDKGSKKTPPGSSGID